MWTGKITGCQQIRNKCTLPIGLVPTEKIINIVIKNKIGIDEIKKNWTIKCKTVVTSWKLNKEQLLFKISNYKIVGKY